MPEISQVRIAAPKLGTLIRILVEATAARLPRWLSIEPGELPRILWWGVSGAAVAQPEEPADSARAGLFPRPVDDPSEGPRGLVLAAVDLERAIADLAPLFGTACEDAGTDDLFGARCRRLQLGRSTLILAEPITEGYAAACLARFGEGPIAVALDGGGAAEGAAGGNHVSSNPIDGGPAVYLRVGPRTGPTFMLLASR